MNKVQELHSDYLVCDVITKSEHSSTYSVIDLVKRTDSQVLKVNQDLGAHSNEKQVYNQIAKQPTNSITSKLIDEFTYQGKPCLLLERLGKPLSQDLDGAILSPVEVSKLALKLVGLLESFHTTGYVLNDLKLDNISTCADGSLRLNNFGLSSRFQTDSGHHLPSETVFFAGSPELASCHALCQQRTSRRDDLNSLFYLLVKLSCSSFPFSSRNANESAECYRKRMRLEKSSMSLRVICDLKSLRWLTEFADEVSSY